MMEFAHCGWLEPEKVNTARMTGLNSAKDSKQQSEVEAGGDALARTRERKAAAAMLASSRLAATPVKGEGPKHLSGHPACQPEGLVLRRWTRGVWKISQAAPLSRGTAHREQIALRVAEVGVLVFGWPEGGMLEGGASEKKTRTLFLSPFPPCAAPAICSRCTRLQCKHPLAQRKVLSCSG